MSINEKTISMLQTAYCMELETIMNYLANSVKRLSNADAERIEYELTDAWVWDMYRQSRFLAKVTIATTKGVTIEELPEREL